MISQLEENLFHLERGRECFNENSRTDGVQWETNVRLGEDEDVVPQACLKVMLHLGEVEIGTTTAFDELLGIMVEV